MAKRLADVKELAKKLYDVWWNADYDDDEFLTMATYIFEHYKKVEK